MTIRPLSFIPSLVLMAASCFSALTYAEMEISSLEAGVFSRPDLQLQDGERLWAGAKPETVEPVRQLAAKLGTKFGLRFAVTGKSARQPNRVTLLYLTPGVVEKNGTRHDKYLVVKELDLNARSHEMAFQITEAYEQVPGTWEFLVFEADRLLLREKFELIAP